MKTVQRRHFDLAEACDINKREDLEQVMLH